MIIFLQSIEAKIAVSGISSIQLIVVECPFKTHTKF